MSSASNFGPRIPELFLAPEVQGSPLTSQVRQPPLIPSLFQFREPPAGKIQKDKRREPHHVDEGQVVAIRRRTSISARPFTSAHVQVDVSSSGGGYLCGVSSKPRIRRPHDKTDSNRCRPRIAVHLTAPGRTHSIFHNRIGIRSAHTGCSGLCFSSPWKQGSAERDFGKCAVGNQQPGFRL